MAEERKKVFTKKRVIKGGSVTALLTTVLSIYLANHQGEASPAPSAPITNEVIMAKLEAMNHSLTLQIQNLQEVTAAQHAETLSRFERQSNFVQSQISALDTRRVHDNDRITNRVENLETAILSIPRRTRNN